MMQLEAMGKPIKYRLKTGEEVTLKPGVPMELPDPAGAQLLKKAPDKVRRVNEATRESAEGRIQTSKAHSLITWSDCEGKTTGPVLVYFRQTEPDGTVWAFYSLPDGNWGMRNMKYASWIESENEH